MMIGVKFMIKKTTKQTNLLFSTASRKRDLNIQYLLSLDEKNLLLPYYFEAAILKEQSFDYSKLHNGWESPLSQVRSQFTGHFLSACAFIYSETKNMQIKAKADYMVSEIGICQEKNGGKWCFGIPEKYMYLIAQGKDAWAPQYVCHKTMMGLLDMYMYADNNKALEIVINAADWFYDFTGAISRQTMNKIMNEQETGGIMELFADLYAITNNPKHLELIKRYERPELYDRLLNNLDPLTNMHANTTVPELHGAARAYEVTNDIRYKQIVEAYWKSAVTDRGKYVTGSQTSGEVFTAPNKQAARLGGLNQEHCFVYNMIRLAQFLFSWTGDKLYSDYIELNIYNGLFAQGYYRKRPIFAMADDWNEDFETVSYYLPLQSGSVKKWGSKTQHFWCCHSTLVQANSRYNEFIYYLEDDNIIVSQYLPSTLKLENEDVFISQNLDNLGGKLLEIEDVARQYHELPNIMRVNFSIESKSDKKRTVKFRLPFWCNEFNVTLNGSAVKTIVKNGYIELRKVWNTDAVSIDFKMELQCVPLLGANDEYAFRYGCFALAGLCDRAYQLEGDFNNPNCLLTPHDERYWMDWNYSFITKNQSFPIVFKPLYLIGKEMYSVYFNIKNK